MAIAYGSISSASQAGITSVMYRAPDVLASGDLIVWTVVNKYPPNAPATPTGLTLLGREVMGDSSGGGADIGDVYCSVYTRESNGTEDAATETVSITSGNSATSRSVSYTRGAGTSWDVAYAWGEQATASTAWSITTGSLDLAAGDVVLAVIAKNSDADGTHTAHALTASGVTFGAAVARTTVHGTTSGDDCASQVVEFPVSSGSGSGAVTFSMSLSGSGTDAAGGVMLVRLREIGGSTPVYWTADIADQTATVGAAFSLDVSSLVGGTETPFTYSAIGSSAPPGLSWSGAVLSGTPTAAGAYSGQQRRVTDDAANTDDSNAFSIAVYPAAPTSDIGFSFTSHTGVGGNQHTTASHAVYHAGSWWILGRGASQWDLYEEGSYPSTAGDAVGWTAHLSSVATLAQASIYLDEANDKLFLISFGGAASTVQFRELTWSGTAWSVTESFNFAGTGGVGVGTGTTFSNHEKLSLGVADGVPFVFAGNKGAGAGATNGCHIAWPDSAINGTWSWATVDSESVSEGDASGRFAGIFSQGGTDYLLVAYTTDGATNKLKLAYHQVEATRSNYATGWVLEIIDDTLSADNHVWGGFMAYGTDQVLVTLTKTGDGAGHGRIYCDTSLLGASLTWTHKRHRVTNGTTDAPPLEELCSRPIGVLDQTNGDVYAFFHERDSYPYGIGGYKKVRLLDLLNASTETEVFDTSIGGNLTPWVWDMSRDSTSDLKGPAHAVTYDMGSFPITGLVTASSVTADGSWINSHPLEVAAAEVSAAISGTVTGAVSAAVDVLVVPDITVTAAILGTVTGTISASVDVSDPAPADVTVTAAVTGSITGALSASATVSAGGGSSASAAEIWGYILPNGLTAGQVFCDLHKIHGLTPGIPLAVTSATRTAGDISQSIADSAGVVTVTRN